MDFLDGIPYIGMIRRGASVLEENRTDVNNLNVFPIPDGDTGDNMLMTVRSGGAISEGQVPEDLGKAAAKAAEGMLLGARGNSGVILSRIFAGIAKGLEGRSKASAAEFCEALKAGVEESYRAVSNPVEGTMLTVFREGAEKAAACLKGTCTEAACPGGASIETLLEAMLTEMRASLERTPDLLPVLKEAGVVDSGGAGLICIFEGMLAYLRGEEPSFSGTSDTGATAAPGAPAALDLDAFTSDSELEFGYCTEFLLRLQSSKVDLDHFDEKPLVDWLNAAGDSVVAFRDGSIFKVHVHTRTPGEILNHCQQYGEFLTLKIENMTLQHHGVQIKDSFKRARKRLGVVTVASGEGLCATFREAGADVVIRGGQTMNPSVQDFLAAFDEAAAETVLVFPNNSNIILTARQAAGMYPKADVRVLPSKDLGAGYAAIASLDKDSRDIDALEEDALATMDSVTTGLVSKASRDSLMDGVQVREGDWIAYCGSKVLCDCPAFPEAAQGLCRQLDAGTHDVALVFSGQDVPAEQATAIVDALGREYPRTEFMLTEGGQPIYDLIIVLC